MKKSALYELHTELGAKMVPFAGYEMPLYFPAGILKEHLHTRSKAGLFDVSHMGQLLLHGKDAARTLELLTPTDFVDLRSGRQRYSVLMNSDGGIIDDMMVANTGDLLLVVVNASRKAQDIQVLEEVFGSGLEHVDERALLALQRPKAESVLARIVPDSRSMRFMDTASYASDFGTLWISRSGYTGEDGFEISVGQAKALALARVLLANDDVEPIGLGARDTLRMEAGLCLYGSDIDELSSPVEAGLAWAISKSRQSGGVRAGGFPGFERVSQELSGQLTRLRVGLCPVGNTPLRSGTLLFAQETAETSIGKVTSGGFGPSVNAPLAMAYVSIENSKIGTVLWADLRGKRLLTHVTSMPFHPTTYKR